MENYLQYGRKMTERIQAWLKLEGLARVPSTYQDFSKLDQRLRKEIGINLPIVLSDDYEHFMACLPGKTFAAQHVLTRKQVGGFTVAAGYWKWLEFLSHQITVEEVELVADFFSGKHNSYRRQFDKNYWLHVVHDYNGYMPLRIEYPGEGTTYTGVPFPLAQVYGERPAVWVNEPMYIQVGYLSHVATIAAQFAEILGDPWRFIEVAFRALHTSWESDDFLLAMLIGGGIISTSNDLGAFVNGAPFKPSGTTGHCYYQQFESLKESLRALLGHPLGKFSTVLLDLVEHRRGFEDLMKVIAEGYAPPFAERPDSGDGITDGLRDLTILQDSNRNINIVIEDSKGPKDVQRGETLRRQYGLSEERTLYGGGSAFIGLRRYLETAYKACYFHDGQPGAETNVVETMKICLDDPMKQSVPGLIDWFYNQDSGVYMLGTKGEDPLSGYQVANRVLYDNLTTPGQPVFDPAYDPRNLATCPAIIEGMARSKATRKVLGPNFTLQIVENRTGIAMTQRLREKRKAIEAAAMSGTEAAKK